MEFKTKLDMLFKSTSRLKILDLVILSFLGISFYLVTNSFSDSYQTGKWFIHSFTIFLMMIRLISSENFYYPSLPKSMKFLITPILFLLILHFFNTNSVYYPQLIIDGLSLAVLILYFYNFISEQKKEVISNLVSVFVNFNFFIILSSLIYLTINSPTFFLPTTFSTLYFGNVNMAAQYCGLIFCLVLTENLIKNNLFKWIYLSLVLIYLTALQCRSVLLSVSIITFYQFIFLNKKINKKSALFFVSVISVFISSLIFSNKYISLSKGTLFERIELWKSTLELIQDHPITGSGYSSFEFAIITYLTKSQIKVPENQIFSTPHNEILRLLAEMGVPLTLLLITFFFIPFYYFFKSSTLPVKSKSFLISFLIFLGIESIFQFPLSITFAFTSISILISYVTYQSFKTNVNSLNNAKYLSIIFPSIFIFTASLKFYSYYVQNHAKFYSEAQNACEAFPLNWKACVLKASLEARQMKYEKAEKTLGNILTISPLHYPTLQVMASVYYESGDHKKMCDVVGLYNKTPLIKPSMSIRMLSRFCPRM